MNLRHTQRNAAFDGLVGTLTVAVISVRCITLVGCTSHATAVAGVPVLHAKARRRLPGRPPAAATVAG